MIDSHNPSKRNKLNSFIIEQKTQIFETYAQPTTLLKRRDVFVLVDVLVKLKLSNYLSGFLEAISQNPNQTNIENFLIDICQFIEEKDINKELAIKSLSKLLFYKIPDFNLASLNCIKQGTFLLGTKNFSKDSIKIRKKLQLPLKGKAPLEITSYRLTFPIDLNRPGAGLQDIFMVYSKYASNEELGEEKLYMMVDFIWKHFRPLFVTSFIINMIPFGCLMLQGLLLAENKSSLFANIFLLLCGCWEIILNMTRILALKKLAIYSLKVWFGVLSCLSILINSLYQLVVDQKYSSGNQLTETKSIYCITLLFYIFKINYSLKCFDGIRSLMNKIIMIIMNMKAFFIVIFVNIFSFTA